MSGTKRKTNASSRRTVLAGAVLATLAVTLVAGGCDESVVSEIDGTGHGLLDQDAEFGEEIIDPNEGEVVGEVYTEAVVGVVLEGVKDGEATGKSLRWTVYNALDEDIVVVPTLRCEGLVALEKNLELVALEIGPKGSAEIELAANGMPIQSELGAGTMQFDFAVSTAKNPERSVRVLSPMWYYRHAQGYEEVNVFIEEVLMERDGGVIFEIPAGIQAKNGVIGRLVDSGQVHEVNALGPELTMGDTETGKYRVTGVSLDVAESENDLETDMAVEGDPEPLQLYPVTWCMRWSALYTDEESQNPTQYIPGYTYGRLQDRDNNDQTVWTGLLNSSGCALVYTKSDTNYRFGVGTRLARAGRNIYVQPELDCQPCTNCHRWHNVSVKTGSPPAGNITLTRSANTPDSRMAVVAIYAMRKYSTLDWQSSVTYLRPSINPVQWCNQNTSCFTPGQCNNMGQIHIARAQPNPDTGQGTIDHSTYRFIIGHEMGHRQAKETIGPSCLNCNGNLQWDTDAPHPCNCESFLSYKAGCFQSRAWTGPKQREAWANFYSSALVNPRSVSGCNYFYWRGMYDSSMPLAEDPDWISLGGPVPVDCQVNVKWMEKYCDDGTLEHKGTTQDWMAFFWNLWTDGQNRASVAEITDIWESTPEYTYQGVNIGQAWDVSPWEWWEGSLLRSAQTKWGWGMPKYDNFVQKGENAGIHHWQ